MEGLFRVSNRLWQNLLGFGITAETTVSPLDTALQMPTVYKTVTKSAKSCYMIRFHLFTNKKRSIKL